MEKWKRRDMKRNKKRYGMRIDSKSVFLIERLKAKRAKKKNAP